jgi:DNA-binding MarR family transcriptional regulator
VLTEAGAGKVEELKPKVSEIRQKAWENLNEGDFEEFKRILNKIYDNLE